MTVNAKAERFQALLEFLRSGLLLPTGENHTANKQAKATECIDQAQRIQILGNTEISTHFILFNIVGIDHDHDLGLLLQLNQHPNLTVRSKSG